MASQNRKPRQDSYPDGILVRLLHQPVHQVILDDSDDERSHPEGEREHWAFLLSPVFLRPAPQAQRSLLIQRPLCVSSLPHQANFMFAILPGK
jgi:hypothetical protein